MLRKVERVVLVAGLVALDIWLLTNARLAIDQAWQEWTFERTVAGQPADFRGFLADKKTQMEQWIGISHQPASAPLPELSRHAPPSVAKRQPVSPQHNAVIGRLIIPRIGIRAIVREGVGEDTLRIALGHIPGTALPGQPGNIGLAGHRDTLFRSLRKIHANDVILLETLNGQYSYRVQNTRVVGPRDVQVLDPDRSPELTLVTCYPFYYVGSAPERFIVKAQVVPNRAPGQPD